VIEKEKTLEELAHMLGLDEIALEDVRDRLEKARRFSRLRPDRI
jgi:penicillin-binding protein 2